MKSIAFTACKLEKLKARLFPVHISDNQLLKRLDGFVSIQEVIDHVRGERPKFFIEPSLKGGLVSLIQKEFPQLKDQIIAEADKVCSHVFDLLGSGDVNLDGFIEQHGGRETCGYLPWHFDFKTGYQWNARKFYKEIRPAYGKADIKVPWELSRFQHVATLCQAYWLTGDEKYAEEFVRQAEDWIDRNPPKFGANWTCTMDVAIRVANWILGFYFFKDSKAFTDDFLIKFLKSLLVHGRHIVANLENKGITTNHYLADLVGLIYLGICFPEFKEAKRWREFGIQELIKEMEKQVYDDGMDFEASTCYHRFALELFFYPALLCRLNGIELPNSFIEKLKKMFDFVLYVLKPNGRMPQIGDNDNGRLHVLGKRDVLDLTYLLTFATLSFGDPKYKIEEFGFAPEALWVFGPEAYEKWKKLPGRSVEELESKAFPDGGIYVMRHKKDYMVVSCGPNGQGGIGGHAHNDKLSFELCVDGEDVIVDPGTYVYTADAELRNRFRSSSYHNAIANAEHNAFSRSAMGLFRLENRNKCSLKKWMCGGTEDVFEGEHSGFVLGLRRVQTLHRRSILYNKARRCWTIYDILTTAGDSPFGLELGLHIAPGVKVFNQDNGLFLRRGEVVVSLRIAGGDSFEVVDSWYSSQYGTKEQSKRVKVHVQRAFLTTYCAKLEMELAVKVNRELHQFGRTLCK